MSKKKIHEAVKTLRDCKNPANILEIGEVLTTDRVWIGFSPKVLEYAEKYMSKTFFLTASFSVDDAEWISKEIMKSVRKRRKGFKKETINNKKGK